MLFTITTTHQPATDLGYLLHKHPERAQQFSLNFGQAHVFYPEASEERCTAALLLDIDPVHLVRGREKGQALEQYVNDRPYVSSSLLSVALAEVFSSALNGHCKARPELVELSLPLRAHLAAVPSPLGADMLHRLFTPLGYRVEAMPQLLDETYPAWGLSSYYALTLEATCRLRDLLNHLYVLIPVLDSSKHYWIGSAEVEKLLQRGQGWLQQHPERDLIAQRYLLQRRPLVRSALARLLPEEAAEEQQEAEAEATEETSESKEEQEASGGVHAQRLAAVAQVLAASGARRVLDLGCGEGRLLKLLLDNPAYEQIVGLDVSYRSLERASKRLRLERLPARQRARITLLHGALTYRDQRIEGYDAAAVVEVIEHLDEARLGAFERVLFEFARPATVVMTTPNAEYNASFATLAAGTFRHEDHRFEWTRPQFQAWAERVAQRYGYNVRFQGVGPESEKLGALSQMGVFSRLA